jgi:hypothetical protein
MHTRSDAYWPQIKTDRAAVMAAIFASPDSIAVWTAIRSLLREADAMGETPQIFEAHHRTYLPILQFDLVSRFVERFGHSGVAPISSSLADEDPEVVAYSLLALARIGLSEIRDGALKVASRDERVQTHFGSFGWEGTLAEYAARLVEDKEDEENA